MLADVDRRKLPVVLLTDNVVANDPADTVVATA